MTNRKLLDAAIREDDFLAQVIEAAHLYKWKAVHFRKAMIRRATSGGKAKWVTPVQADGAGWPDLVLLHPERGQLLVAECKSEKGRVTPAQERWLEAFGGLANCWAFVWKPSMWDSIVAVLKGDNVGNLAQGKDEA